MPVTTPQIPPPAPPTTPITPPTRHFRCVAYAVRTIFRVLPALGRASDHVSPPPGLGIKHFVVAGVLSAGLLVGAILVTVRAILGVVGRY